VSTRPLAVLAGLLLLAGCSSPDSAWQAAEQDGSEDALLEFLHSYPDSPQAADARQRVVALSVHRDWEAALAEGSAAALEVFLHKHPDSRYSQQARGRLDTLRVTQAWAAIMDSDDPEALRVFADAWPGMPEAGLARQRISVLGAGEAAVESSEVQGQAPAPAATPAADSPEATHRVQLAALASAAAATREQERISARMGDALADLPLQVESAGNAHRVVSGLLTEGEARALCSRLQAAGQDCFVRRR